MNDGGRLILHQKVERGCSCNAIQKHGRVLLFHISSRECVTSMAAKKNVFFQIPTEGSEKTQFIDRILLKNCNDDFFQRQIVRSLYTLGRSSLCGKLRFIYKRNSIFKTILFLIIFHIIFTKIKKYFL